MTGVVCSRQWMGVGERQGLRGGGCGLGRGVETGVRLLLSLMAVCGLGIMLLLLEWRPDSPWPTPIPDIFETTPRHGAGESRILVGEVAMVTAARALHARHGLVLYTLINDAYLPFAASWLCNTKPLQHVHQHVLLVATDKVTAQRLAALTPEVSVVALNDSTFSGDQQYSHVGYVQVMAERTRQILCLLEAGVRLLLFEVDCVWLADPLPMLKRQSQQAWDVVATRVQNRTAGGFLLLHPTARTLALWRRLTDKMAELLASIRSQSRDQWVPHWLNDQEFLAELVAQRFAGVRVQHLPTSAFPDGTWYDLPPSVRRRPPPPVIINNNFIAGNANKKERARRFGHWFLRPGDPLQGNLSQVCDPLAIRRLFS